MADNEFTIGSLDLSKDGVTYHFSPYIPYGVCDTAAAIAAKAVTVSPVISDLKAGVSIRVKFTNSNTAANPTLSVNADSAKNIYRYGTTAPSTDTVTSWQAGSVFTLTYDGTAWIMNDWLNDPVVSQTNTTTSANYNLLMSYSTSTTSTKKEGSRKSSNLYYNPSTKALNTGGSINGYTLGSACSKSLIGSYNANTDASTFVGSSNIPSAKAVAQYVASETGKVLIISNILLSSSNEHITVTKTDITSDMVVVGSYIADPNKQLEEFSVETSDGSLTITGKVSDSTTLTLYLMKSRTAT